MAKRRRPIRRPAPGTAPNNWQDRDEPHAEAAEMPSQVPAGTVVGDAAPNALDRFDPATLSREIDALTKAIERDPVDAEAFLKRGGAFQNRADARRWDSTTWTEIPRARLRRPEVAAAAADLGLAIADYTRAVELDSTCVQAHAERAEACNEWVALDPSLDLFKRLELLDLAIADYTRVMELRLPTFLEYHGRASARAARGDATGARADFDIAVSMVRHGLDVEMAKDLGHDLNAKQMLTREELTAAQHRLDATANPGCGVSAAVVVVLLIVIVAAVVGVVWLLWEVLS